MKIGKFTVLAVSAGLIGLGISQFDMNPMEKEIQNDNAPHFITQAEATTLWNKMLNKNEQLPAQENLNSEKKIVKAGFNPMLAPPINQDDDSHYITKDEAAKLLDKTVIQSKEIAKDINIKIAEVLQNNNKGIEQLLAGDVKENTNEVKKVIKAQFSPIKTENLIKAKDKTIDAMIDALEKMRSEPRKKDKENKPK
jgi:uncharacterized Rossmann fold enzyme